MERIEAQVYTLRGKHGVGRVEIGETQAYNQDDATGFIRLNALRLKVAAKVQRNFRT